MGGNLPVVPVDDLAIKGVDLVVATHGRSFWILDDLTPLHQLRDELDEQDVVLFQPRPTVRMRSYGGGAAQNNEPSIVDYTHADTSVIAVDAVRDPDGAIEHRYLDAGENPPEGVVIHYYLKEAPTSGLSLTIHDASGNVLRTFDSDARTGSRGSQPLCLEVAPSRSAGRERPDTRIVVAAERCDGPPGNLSGSPDGKRRDRITDVRDRRGSAHSHDARGVGGAVRLPGEVLGALSATNDMINGVGTLLNQLGAWDERAVSQAAADEIAEARDALNEIRGKLIDVNIWQSQLWPSGLHEKFNALFESVDSADYAPPAQAREVFAKLVAELNDLDERFGTVLNGRLPPLNRSIEEAGLPAVGLPSE